MDKEQMIAHLILHGWEPYRNTVGNLVARNGARFVVRAIPEEPQRYSIRENGDPWTDRWTPWDYTLAREEHIQELYACIMAQQED